MKQKKEKSKGVFIPLIFIALAVILCGIGTASAATPVEMSPAEKTVANGETFTVNITINPDTAIGGAQADLTFDPSLVTVNSVDDGGMFPGFMLIGPIDNVEGTVTGIIGYFTGGATTTTPGTLATISMTANATNAGTTTLGLFNVKVTDGAGTEVPSTVTNGSVVVGLIPPSVSVVYPNGGETLSGTVTVNATASDEDGTVTNVEFLYSADGGSTWTSLGSDTTEPYEYGWDTTTVANGVNYLVKAIATDNDEATSVDTSDSTFTIDNPVVGTAVSISPSTKTVGLGDTFTVNIEITPDTAIGGAQADLTFDPSLVTVNSVDNGGMFPGFMVIEPIDNVEGTVTGIIGYFTGGATTTAPGTLATVSMTANTTNTGTTTVGLFNVKVTDGAGTEVSSTASNGSVTVGEVGAPTIVEYTISKNTITPPETTEIDVEFSEKVEAWIKIEDESRNLVNELYHSTGVTDPDPKTWDGKYANGTIVAPGDYYVNVTGTNTTTELSVVNNTQTITVEVLAEQVPVSDALDSYFNPDIAVNSSTGYIYVAFEGITTTGIDFAKSTNDGASFNTQIPVSTAGVDAAIATYGENNVYVVWVEGYKIYYARSINGGDNFETKVLVSDGGAGSYSEHPDIAVDSNGVIYVVWDYDTGTDYTISIDKSTDGTTFGTDVRVDDDTVTVVKNPSIAIDSSNNILVAWQGGDHVYFANSIDGGANFGDPVQIDDSDVGATDPSIVVDPTDSNKIYVAWQDARNLDGGDIYAAASSDGGAIFGIGVKVNDDTTNTATAQKFPCMAVNTSGAIFVVWQDGRNYTSSDYDVYFAGSLDGGSTFSENSKANPAGTKAKTPTLAVDDTNAFVAWRCTDDNRIYFAKKLLVPEVPTPVLTTITVTPATADVAVDGTREFTATAYDQNSEVLADVVITWTSSNETVGTVSPATNTTGADGTATTTFTALAEGTTTVMAESAGVSGTAEVNVTTGLPKTGNMDGVGTVDFADAIYLARHVIFGAEDYPLHADGNVDSINGVDFADAIYLARHVIFGAEDYPLYP